MVCAVPTIRAPLIMGEALATPPPKSGGQHTRAPATPPPPPPPPQLLPNQQQMAGHDEPGRRQKHPEEGATVRQRETDEEELRLQQRLESLKKRRLEALRERVDDEERAIVEIKKRPRQEASRNQRPKKGSPVSKVPDDDDDEDSDDSDDDSDDDLGDSEVDDDEDGDDDTEVTDKTRAKTKAKVVAPHKLAKLRSQRGLRLIQGTGDQNTAWLVPTVITEDENWLFPQLENASYGAELDQVVLSWRHRLSHPGRTCVAELAAQLKSYRAAIAGKSAITEQQAAAGAGLVHLLLLQFSIPDTLTKQIAPKEKGTKWEADQRNSLRCAWLFGKDFLRLSICLKALFDESEVR